MRCGDLPYCVVPLVQQWVELLGPASGQANLHSLLQGYPGARPAAPDPGPAGPVHPCCSASRAPCQWARAGLSKSSGRRGLRSLRAPTSSLTLQPDAHGLRLAAPRRHCAGRSARPREPLRCHRRGHVAAPGPGGGPRPNCRVDTSCGHGDMGDGGGRCASSLVRPMGYPAAQHKLASVA
jgi:hypothetical protein